MKKLLAIAGVCVLLSSCGVEELESGTRFISKTQAGEGEHARLFLINKVTKPANSTLKVRVNVGTWQVTDANAAVWNVGDSTSSRKTNVCVTHPAAVVRGAIAQWLTPLREVHDNIISDSKITFTTEGTADLVVNFVCKESLLASSGATPNWSSEGLRIDLPGCPTPYYSEGRSCTTFDGKVIISIGDFDEFRYAGPNDPKVHNAAFAGFGDPPSPGRDKIAGDGKEDFVLAYPPEGEGDTAGGGDDDEDEDKDGSHDMLDLLHELGHAFGLADTHRAGVFGYPKHRQPLSIMSGNRTPTRGSPRLQLGYDDKRGIRWLYQHMSTGTGTCPPDYAPEGVGCVPEDTLLYALLTDDYEQALELLKYAQRNPTKNSININDKETAAHGNTALHLAVFRFSGSDEEERKDAYLEIIRLILDDPNLEPDETRADGDTALHLAVRLDSSPYDAVELLLTSTSVTQTAAQPDKRGDTVLHLAARMGDNELVEILDPIIRTTGGSRITMAIRHCTLQY